MEYFLIFFTNVECIYIDFINSELCITHILSLKPQVSVVLIKIDCKIVKYVNVELIYICRVGYLVDL